MHFIGKHRWADIASRSIGSSTSTTRQIEYFGMTANVQLSSAAPNAYELLALDVSSRRWHIGPLSVGQNSWRSVKDPSLEGIGPDGGLDVLGARDSARLIVRGSRIDKVTYNCAGADPK